MFRYQRSLCNYLTEIIELQEIPLSIPNQEDEKVFLSNLILDILRKNEYARTKIELLCTSNRTENQIHSAIPHFYVALHKEFDDTFKEEIKDEMRKDIGDISIVLTRMGYKIQEVGKSDKVMSIPLIPSQLIGKEVYWINNGSDEVAHKLRNASILSIWNNILNLMANNMPESLLSFTLKGDGLDNILSNIQIVAENDVIARSLYFYFIQGSERQYNPDGFPKTMYNPFDFWTISEDNENPQIISYGELAKFLQLPYGDGSHLKTRKVTRMLPPFPSGLINGDGVTLGNIKNADDKMLTLPLQEKVNHVSILGLSGSGKSNFLLNFLHEMWDKYKIPYLVLDPVTTEYRKLVEEDKTKVFTPGDNTSPLEFNPFMLCCKNITIKQHKAILKDFLRGVLNLHSPLDRLIDETVENVFIDNGWVDISTLEYLPGKRFTLNEVIKTFDKVFKKSKFTGNLMNVASSGRVRLNGLRQWFDTISRLPIAGILSTPSVVELQSMGSPESKCTLLLYLLQMTKAYMQATCQECTGSKPRLILVIDEAHSILEVSDQGEGMNLAQRAVISEINKILLEFRKYGLMLVLADQRLSILESQMTNTHLQVIFKQTGYKQPADLIGLEEAELLTRLQAGECFVKYETIEAPVEIKTLYKDRSQHPTSNEYITKYMQERFWNKYYIYTASYKECQKCPLILSKRRCNLRNRSLIRDYTRIELNMNKDNKINNLRDKIIELNKIELNKYEKNEIDNLRDKIIELKNEINNLRDEIITDIIVNRKLVDKPLVRHCINAHITNLLFR